MSNEIKDYSKSLEKLILTVDDKIHGQRLDGALQVLLPHRSRSFYQKRIAQRKVLLNDQPSRPSRQVHLGDVIVVEVDPHPSWIDPLSIPLEIIDETNDLIVVNKAPWQIIHPTGPHQGGTLLNALHARHLKQKGRTQDLPRVVHRLDQETSGVVVFSKGERAAAHYGQVFENRLVSKIYLTLLDGVVRQPFSVKQPIGDDLRHPVQVRQWITSSGKSAHSDFYPLKWNQQMTLCAVKIFSGRLHQIRVHAAYSQLPVCGDPLYNPRDEDYGRWLDCREPQPQAGRPQRQLLHAWQLHLPNLKMKKLVYQAPLPDDFKVWGSDLIEDWAGEAYCLPEE